MTSLGPELEQLLRDGASALGFELSDGQIGALLDLTDRAGRDRERLDLGSIREPTEFVRRQILESLALLNEMEGRRPLDQTVSLVDIGSGAGVPGLPIAIVRPQVRVCLIEGSTRKAEWLEGTARAIGVDVEVLPLRAEEAGRRAPYREAFDLATAKAVAPLPRLLELAIPLLRVGGLLFSPKGSRLDQEIAGASSALKALQAEVLSVTTIGSAQNPPRLVTVKKLALSEARYPRTGAAIKKPL